jgi:hypothetical protein
MDCYRPERGLGCDFCGSDGSTLFNLVTDQSSYQSPGIASDQPTNVAN